MSFLSKGLSSLLQHQLESMNSSVYIYIYSEREKTVMFIARINVGSSVRGIFCKCSWDSNLHMTSLAALCSVYLQPEPQLVQNKLTPLHLTPNNNYSYQVDAFVILTPEVCCSLLLMFMWKRSQIPENTLNFKLTSPSNNWKSISWFHMIIRINLFSQDHKSFFFYSSVPQGLYLMASFQHFWLPFNTLTIFSLCNYILFWSPLTGTLL